MNRDMTPGPPEGQEPIEQLFRDVFELAEETARRITNAEVDARLDRLLRKTGHAAPPAPEPNPASVLDAAYHQAGEIVADARRAAAEREAKAACAAQAAEEAARHEAERMIAEAEQYSDTALSRAAAIIADARGRAESIAESIIAEAKEQAGQIVADARLRAGRADIRARQLALTDSGICGPYDVRMSALFAALHATAGLTAAELDDQLPRLPAACDLRALDDKVRVTFTRRVLKSSLDFSQDRETLGWVLWSWRAVRARMKLRPGYLPTRWLMMARADGVVTSIYYACTQDDGAYVPDLRWLISDYCPLETIGEEQPPAKSEGYSAFTGRSQPTGRSQHAASNRATSPRRSLVHSMNARGDPRAATRSAVVPHASVCMRSNRPPR